MSWAPLKHAADVSPSNVDKLTVEGELPVRLINYTDVYYGNRLVPHEGLMSATATKAEIRKFQLRPGDVIMTKDSETPEDIGVAACVERSEPGLVCGYHLSLVRPRSALGRYLYYAISSAHARDQMSVAATGITRFGLRSESIASLSLWFPPLGEQRAIADYLDTETARIDALITKKRRLIQLLEERAHATLVHLATKRWLDGHRVALKRVANRRLQTPDDVAEIITAYRDGQVTSRSSRRSEGYTVADDESGYLEVLRGDLVFHGLDGFAGAVGVAELDGKCSPVYHVCVVASPNSSRYIADQLRALALSGYVSLQASSVRQRAVDLRNWERFGRLEISLPPPVEQVSASDEIHRWRRGSSLVIDKSQRQLDLLTERRQALITAAVTGELEIPGLAA